MASKASSLPEIVREGESGLLVEPGDAEGFARSILELALQPALRATMGARACQLALQNFSPKPIYDRLENLLLQRPLSPPAPSDIEVLIPTYRMIRTIVGGH